MTLRFRNPQTGQMHQIKADVVQKLKADSPQRAESLRHDVQDGKVDLYVDDSKKSNWSPDRNIYHLQIDKTKLSPQEMKLLFVDFEFLLITQSPKVYKGKNLIN